MGFIVIASVAVSDCCRDGAVAGLAVLLSVGGSVIEGLENHGGVVVEPPDD